jgi:ABC-type phosphate transport system substrate-binding protein
VKQSKQDGQGNEGVTVLIQQNEGAIGYVEHAYDKLNEIPMTPLENAFGNFIEPSPESTAAAFENVEIPEDFGLLVPNPENEDAFPIAVVTSHPLDRSSSNIIIRLKRAWVSSRELRRSICLMVKMRDKKLGIFSKRITIAPSDRFTKYTGLKK